MRFLLAGTLGALLVTATPARADVIGLGNGMVYDTVQDLTWLQDTRYAWTSGADTDEGMPYYDAIAWVDALEYGGYDDWRLPKYFVPRREGRPDFVEEPWSEISVLMGQLGWHWTLNAPGFWSYVAGTTEPFRNFESTTATNEQFWIYGNAEVWNRESDWDIPDHGPYNGSVGAWAVRDGRVSVPEPSTLMLVALGVVPGLLAAKRARRRTRP